MNLRDVWTGIGGWIGGVFGLGQDKSTPEQKVAYAYRAGGNLNAQFLGDGGEQELIQGIVADCINIRASERTVLRFVVTVYDRTDHPIAVQLQNMMDCPNPIQSSIDFIESASQSYDANGTAWIMLIADDKGIPCEQYVMPSNYVVPRFDASDAVIPIGYQWKDGRATVAPEDLVIIRRNSIKTEPYQGQGVTSDSKKTLNLLNSILLAQQNYFINGGAPNVAMMLPEGADLSPQAILLYQQMWNQKYNPTNQTTNIAILPGGATIKDFGTSEVDYNGTKESVKYDILQHFQTPLMMLGDVGDANFNNGQVAVAIFERSVVLRFGQKMAAAYQMRFRRNIGPMIKVIVDPEVIDSFTALSPMNGLQTASNGNTDSRTVPTNM